MSEQFPSRDLVFEFGRTGLQDLLGYSDALDTKALTLFVAANVIISVTAALVKDIEINGTLALFILALCAYVFIGWQGLTVIFPKRMKGPNDPEILRNDFWKLPPDKVKEEYWGFLEKGYQQVYKIVESKARAVKCCVVALPVEVILLGAWVLLQT